MDMVLFTNVSKTRTSSRYAQDSADKKDPRLHLKKKQKESINDRKHGKETFVS